VAYIREHESKLPKGSKTYPMFEEQVRNLLIPSARNCANLIEEKLAGVNGTKFDVYANRTYVNTNNMNDR
jgi:hypothetical protein